jgi:LuxR family maltose regulon positive regulatory protein
LPGARPGREADDLNAIATQFVAPPQPYGLIERPRLSERLAAGLRGPVTLVCGPAGSGKTTLLASALRPDRGRRVAWVSLEPEDDEPRRLWYAVLTALSTAGVPAALLGSPPAGDERSTFLPLLINGLAELTEPVILVLDDVHHLRSREVLADLSFLLLHNQGPLRIVLSSRADPALNLHLLRVRGGLTEIRMLDLAFTESEAAELIAAHGLELAPDLMRALRARTEGWAAGLRLAALSLQRSRDPEGFVREFAGDDRVIADYLLAEVLDRHSPEQRRFLLQTSIADRICGDLARAVTGRDGSADLLAGLERTTGFVIALDSRREWYRYHRLFANLLQCRARRELSEELPQLHGRAAHWFAARGFHAHSLRHAVAASDWELAVSLILNHWLELLMRGHGGLVRRLAEQLPEDVRSADSELAAVLACAALETGEADAATAHMRSASASEPRLPEGRQARYLSTLAVARLLEARHSGDLQAALAVADELGGSLPSLHSGGAALVHLEVGRSALWARDFERARLELESGLAVAGAASLGHLSVAAMGSLGLVGLMARGPDAVACAQDAVALAGKRGWTTTGDLASAFTALAMAAFFGLRRQTAERHLASARGALNLMGGRQLEVLVHELAARVAAAAGQPREGLRLLSAFQTSRRAGALSALEDAALASIRARLLSAVGEATTAEAHLAPVRGTCLDVEVTAARLKLASGDADAAIDILESAREAELAGLHLVADVERGVIEALAYDRVKDAAAASAALDRALSLSEASGHRSPFLDGGARIEALLREHGGAAHSARAVELLLAFRRRDHERPVVAAPPLIPFTERELALLRYLPTALSNHEIASELIVSTNTVKTHLRSIYQKLGVSRRRDAVERARDLRLLSGRGA